MVWFEYFYLMVWFEYFYLKQLQKKEIILLSVMNRIYDITLELDILCPESDSRKLVLGSLVKKNLSNWIYPLICKNNFL